MTTRPDTLAKFKDIIIDHFENLWITGGYDPDAIIYENEITGNNAFIPTTDKNEWVYLQITVDASSQPGYAGTHNRIFNREGFINFIIYTKAGTGTDDADVIYDKIVNGFEGVNVGRDIFITTVFQRVMEPIKDWNRLSVAIGYSWDVHK